MEQKKNQKDVLIVRDEKTGEISVVAGLKKDGTPKTIAASGANQKDFLLFDKNSNPLDSFLDNFFRQCKEPKRFGFYRVAAENIEHVIDVLKDLLKNPEKNRDLLEPHHVDTSKYEQQAQTVPEEVKPTSDAPNDLNPFWQAVEEHWFPDEKDSEKPKQEQEQTQDGQSAQEKPDEKKHLIDESRIDWANLEEQYGIKREALEASGDVEKMLGYGKSALVTVTPLIAGERYEIEARLSFKEMPDGSIGVVPHTIRKEPRLDEKFMEHEFTPEDKENLKKTGNMGRVVELVDKETGEIIPSYVSIDRQTNEIEAIPVKDVPVTTRIGQTEFTEHEIAELVAGRALPNKEIVLSEKRKFTATLQVNVERRGVEFVPKPKQNGQNRRQRNGQVTGQTAQQPARPVPTAQAAGGQTATGTEGEQKPKVYKFQWLDENGNIRAPKTMGGIPLTQQQQQNFTAGNAILVKDMKRDGKGEPFTAYVKFSFEAGKPKYYRNNPDVAQEITPASESRTQVAVNTHGNTNEATRHLNQPLQQGQTAPANTQQQRTQNRAAGVRM
ncbi:DUF4099 domain-containing protein [Parabacteroides distasonis]|uniref:DUF4099 domain-containing protein n=1 Tax=Parabacteroides distasonis TaxID=823 RepID=UPI0028051BB1|nr:DUF4099 domain-containing protein [Parabacteroides distasonis]WMI43234.1 DUF4099 domain-containing protein [Parabacteroides distasonis]